MKFRWFSVWLATLLVATAPAWAAEWKPAKRIEVVVPNAPGGGNYRLVRLVLKIAQEQRLIEPVVNVIHKPGAGVVMGLSYLNGKKCSNVISSPTNSCAAHACVTN